ncbi:uncharacterized protein LOC134743382 [Cydia strobilella]|uniref:uncharacterized protein LOC134743382 n=1 Tax=Cydia strobilella TaxID=1100964 RepID=UPI0030058990
MPYVPGGDCNVGNVTKGKECDGCFPSKSKSPIVVKICRPINHNVNRLGYGNRFPSNQGDCCKCRAHKGYANQMVSNQNKIANFDLINRINDASGMSPMLTYTATPPGGPPGKRKCDNCINILRDKELQLLKKEQEILKIKTHFTNLPKSGGQEGLGTNCEHCFKALREKEFELFRKEQEIAKMKMAVVAKSPLDTQAKVDRARCTNCFKALRQKELELIKKEHALMKNMTRPNINVKNLNYCSCCRDKKKSSINQMKKQEELRKKNRDNCFKQLRMKEIRLLAKEREIDKKIQKFREESIAKAKMDLEKTPDPRLIKPTTQEVLKCSCSCTGLPEPIKEKEKPPGICKYLYKKFPTAPGGRRGQTMPMVTVKSQDTKLSAKALKERKCSRPCCFIKMASNMAACFLTPPKVKKPKELPETCRFMKMLPWCSPGQPKTDIKCCIVPTKLEQPPPIKEQIRIEERIKKQKAIAIKAAKAAAKSASPYRVDTIGQIRPGKIRPSSKEKLNVLEAEVLRSYGPRGLQAYKTKMAELKIDTQVAHAKLPKKIHSGEERFQTEMPKKYTFKEAKHFISKMGVPGRPSYQVPGQSRGFYSSTRLGADQGIEVPGSKFTSTRGTFKTKVYDRATKAAKQFRTKVEPGYAKKPGEYIEEGGGYKPEGAYSATKRPITSKTIVDERREDRMAVAKQSKSKIMIGDDGFEVPQKYKAIFADDKTEVSRKFKAKMKDWGENSKKDQKYAKKYGYEKGREVEDALPRKYKIFGKGEDEVPRKYKIFGKDEEPRKYKIFGKDEEPRKYKIFGKDEDELPRKYKKYRKERDDYESALPKRYRTKVGDEGYEVPRGYGSRHGSGDYYDEFPGEYGSREKMRGPIPCARGWLVKPLRKRECPDSPDDDATKLGLTEEDELLQIDLTARTSVFKQRTSMLMQKIKVFTQRINMFTRRTKMFTQRKTMSA